MISLRWDCIAIVWGYECLAPTPIELMFPRSLSSTSRNPVLPPPIQTEPINIFTRGQPTLSPVQNRRSPPSSDGPRLCRQNIFLGRRELVVCGFECGSFESGEGEVCGCYYGAKGGEEWFRWLLGRDWWVDGLDSWDDMLLFWASDVRNETISNEWLCDPRIGKVRSSSGSRGSRGSHAILQIVREEPGADRKLILSNNSHVRRCSYYCTIVMKLGNGWWSLSDRGTQEYLTFVYFNNF